MAQPKVEMVPYYNSSKQDKELRVSVTPGNMDQAFVFPAGKTAKAPKGYEKFFKRNGIVPAKSDAKSEDKKGDKPKG